MTLLWVSASILVVAAASLYWLAILHLTRDPFTRGHRQLRRHLDRDRRADCRHIRELARKG